MENEPFALEMLKELKAESKRRFIVIIVLLALWFATIAGFIWYISLPVDEEVVTIDNDDGNANYIGNDMNGDLYNGENNGEKN